MRKRINKSNKLWKASVSEKTTNLVSRGVINKIAAKMNALKIVTIRSNR